MIQIKQLYKKYQKVQALSGADLTAEPGKITGLLGPNGCGKTTLIKIILGLVPFDQGTVLVGNTSVDKDCHYRHKLGYMPQNPDFPANLRIDEILTMLEDIRGKKAILKDELLQKFRVTDLLKRPFGNLSGGTKQKITAIAAMMFDPEVLILDEPTVGLDPVSVVTLRELTSTAAKKGHTVLLVSHVMSEIELLSQQITFFFEGKDIFSGTALQICQHAGASRLDDAIVHLMNTAKT